MNPALQKFIFESEPTRRELLRYAVQEYPRYKIQVFRNHSFELIEHTIGAYLDYAGIGASFIYSGYDDSFSFVDLDRTADAVIIWVDTTRYKAGTVSGMLPEIVVRLRSTYSGKVLVVPFGEEIEQEIKGALVFHLDGLQKEFGESFTDKRAEAVSGTPLSNKAMLKISRELGLRYLPTLLEPALKAIVVDLDNTIYQGVLGEDGPDGLVLTEGHRLLQEKLKKLAEEGFFLCAISKNDSNDVDELFGKRPDFPLQRSDFSQIYASWDEKKSSIIKLAAYLNIGTDSMVFVDDNIGELTAVQLSIPGIRLIRAYDDGNLTCRVLDEFPGLFKSAETEEDQIRKKDIQANEERQSMLKSMSEEDYIQHLEIELSFSVDNQAQAQRISELSNKTNQFIFNYGRYTLTEIENMMSSDEYHVVSVSMSDRLSDSGLIGVCVGHCVLGCVQIEECFVSCRALGRGIDRFIVLGAIQILTERFGEHNVRVLFQDGPRNLPARKFIDEYLDRYKDSPNLFSFETPNNGLKIKKC